MAPTPTSKKTKETVVSLDISKKEAESEKEKPKKTKSFKIIRGLLTGESRRKKKARKLAEAETANKDSSLPTGAVSSSISWVNPGNDDGLRSDDESTIFGVQVDDNGSVATGVSEQRSTPLDRSILSNLGTDPSVPRLDQETANNKKGSSYILKVVLLLMDPSSRRFELLQLEFDSLKALVSDVLSQIPISVTEAALREQNYVGICGVDANQMSSSQLLSEFCFGNEVLVAMPSNITPKECVRLARPILSDEKVIIMVSLNYF